MAFQKKGAASTQAGSILDSSQIGKLQESGLQVTPVGDTSVLANTTQVTKQVAPGVIVKGNQDIAGNFFVTDTKGIVSDVKPLPSPPVGSAPQTGGPLLVPPVKDFAPPPNFGNNGGSNNGGNGQ